MEHESKGSLDNGIRYLETNKTAGNCPYLFIIWYKAFLINETKHLLRNQVLDEEEKDFNFTAYDLEETPIETALEDAETFLF